MTSCIEQALRQLPETCRLCQYLIKRPAATFPVEQHKNPTIDHALRDRGAFLTVQSSALFEFELYMVILHDGWPAARPIRRATRVAPARPHLRRFFSLAEIARTLAGLV